jgi:hypothetical protein
MLPVYTGLVFEDICRDWVGRVSSLGSSAVEVGSWWSRKSDIEVDVAAVDRSGYTLLGSCKWWQQPVGENVLDHLLSARAAIGPRANRAELAIFAKSGFTDELVARSVRDCVRLFTVDDLFE